MVDPSKHDPQRLKQDCRVAYVNADYTRERIIHQTLHIAPVGFSKHQMATPAT